MKLFIAFVAVVAVAVASPLAKFKPATNELAEIEAIIAAINSPNTHPATAALLEEQLGAIIAELSPISVGPAIVESNPISVGPAIIDFPLPDGGVVTAEEELVNPSPVVVPSPVIIGEIPSGETPLVQIIVNVIAPESAVLPSPADNAVVDEVYVPGPVNVVDHVVAPFEPVQVVEPIVPGPVNVVDNVVVEPVIIATPVVVEPVLIGTPVIPSPVILPAILN